MRDAYYYYFRQTAISREVHRATGTVLLICLTLESSVRRRCTSALNTSTRPTCGGKPTCRPAVCRVVRAADKPLVRSFFICYTIMSNKTRSIRRTVRFGGTENRRVSFGSPRVVTGKSVSCRLTKRFRFSFISFEISRKTVENCFVFFRMTTPASVSIYWGTSSRFPPVERIRKCFS